MSQIKPVIFDVPFLHFVVTDEFEIAKFDAIDQLYPVPGNFIEFWIQVVDDIEIMGTAEESLKSGTETVYDVESSFLKLQLI